jgi:hypothetical protein
MIEDAQLAETVGIRLLAIFGELEDTVRLVASEAPADLQVYKQAIGQVCGSLVLDVMAPLYKTHPKIKPPSWT